MLYFCDIWKDGEENAFDLVKVRENKMIKRMEGIISLIIGR